MFSCDRECYEYCCNQLGFEPLPSRGKQNPYLWLGAQIVQRWSSDIETILKIVDDRQKEKKFYLGVENHRYTHGIENYANVKETAAIGRPDFIVRNGQPRILELNLDSAVGGLVQVTQFSRHWDRTQLRKDKLKIRSPLSELGEYILSIVNDAPRKCAIIYCGEERTYQKVQAESIADYLSSHTGHNFIAARPEEIEFSDYFMHDGDRLAFVFSTDVVMDKQENSPLVGLFQNAKNTQTLVMSSNRYKGVEDKKTLAILWEELDSKESKLTEQEKETLQRVLPPTFLIDNPNKLTKLRDQGWGIDSKNEWVLKRCYSFGGARVYIGNATTADTWQYALKQSLIELPFWVLQKYEESDGLVRVQNSSRYRLQKAKTSSLMTSVVSPFILENRIIGFLCRSALSTDEIIGLNSSGKNFLLPVAEEAECVENHQ